MREDRGIQDHRGTLDLGHACRSGGNRFDLIEKRVENSMLTKQGIGQLHGRSPFPSIAARGVARKQ